MSSNTLSAASVLAQPLCRTPAIGDQFSVEESPTMVFTCTRVDLSGARELFPSIVDGHDAVIYSEIHSHKQY